MNLATTLILVLAGVGIGLVGATGYALRNWTSGWRWIAGAPLLYVIVTTLKIVVDVRADPTSHNLWPFEMLGTLAIAAVVLGALYLVANAKRLWLEWTIATLVGYSVGTLAILPWLVGAAYAAQPTLWSGLVGGGVLGIGLGVAQWLILRRHTSQARRWWLLATIVGAALGLACGLALADLLVLSTFTPATRDAAALVMPWRAAMQAGITGAVFGLVLGGAQWLALRRSRPIGGEWIAASGLGWLVGMGLGAALAAVISVLGALLVTGVISGVITGFALQCWGEPTQWGKTNDHDL